MLEALAIFVIAIIANLQDFTGTSFIGRPLVTGMLVGIVMGDITNGLLIGATLELIFMGLMGVGATVPPDEVSGGILATAFALKTGSGVDVALTLALPIATLGLVVKNFLYVVVIPAMSQKADRLVEKGEITKAANVHIWASLTRVFVMSILIAASYYIGSGAVESIVNAIPQAFVDGMGIATGILPAVGFAMLIGMTYSKKVAPFFFLGFVLAAYLKMDMLAIAIIGGICGTVMYIILNEIDSRKPKMEVLEDEDF